MAVDHVGVHTSHCCRKCGCKYCDPECPVVLGLFEAEYECEDCEFERQSLKETFSRMTLSELSETLLHLNKLIKTRQENGHN